MEETDQLSKNSDRFKSGNKYTSMLEMLSQIINELFK